jgi:SagB-type dehydrogenase family enzyme
MPGRGLAVLLVLFLTACTSLPAGGAREARDAQAPAGPAAAQAIALPTPLASGAMSLEEALARRRSVRDFAATPLTLTELGQLLWAAQGITSQDGRRTAPSAGALYPLELYAVTAEAVYYYEPGGHRLSVHLAGDRRPELYAAALSQATVLEAPAVLVIAAVVERTERKYGAERSPRYVHLEAGHAAQNILLQAVALDLGAVPIGAFYDNQVQQALALPADHQPLYLIPAGHPRR